MRPKKLFSKLFPSYFLISLVGLSVLLLITRFAFRNFYYQQTSKQLTHKAHLIEDVVKEAILQNNYSRLQTNIFELSKKSENRITIILPSGKVIADSDYAPEKMGLHNEREEIKRAMTGEIGKTIRFSPTLREKHLYVAIPLSNSGKIIGVLRNSLPIDELQTSLFILTRQVLIWSLVLLIILTYFIYIQAKKISSPLESMKKQVEDFAAGNFQNKIEIDDVSTLEISSLFNAVQTMSDKLQKQFKKITKQKNEQLAVFASMLEGVITIYPDMNIYHINDAALKLFKYDSDAQIKGTPLKEVVKSDRIYNMAKKLLEDHVTVDNEFEYESGLVLNVHGTILQSKKTGMLGAVLVFNDITKMRELENHRKQFVANVSHELKTPLTAIQGYLETIQEEEIDDKALLNKFLGIINKHSIRLKRIIEDLLALSSIERESEFGGLELEEANILPVLENVISLCFEKAEKKQIIVKLKGEDAFARINRPLFEQAIINLLDNAIKYGPEKSEVEILTNINEKKLEIIVKDNGQGIPKEHHDRLFERFYSVDKARSRELGGSGLGLSIVKHIAITHHGNVRVESEIGKGSSFIFELPSL